MPISADRFDSMRDPDDGPTPGTNAHEVLSFLEDHADEAFTQSEIADATGIAKGPSSDRPSLGSTRAGGSTTKGYTGGSATTFGASMPPEPTQGDRREPRGRAADVRRLAGTRGRPAHRS